MEKNSPPEDRGYDPRKERERERDKVGKGVLELGRQGEQSESTGSVLKHSGEGARRKTEESKERVNYRTTFSR